MKFRIVEGVETDYDAIYDDFKEDYLHTSQSNKDIRRKFDLSQKDFAIMADRVKEDEGISYRPIMNAKYYYRKGNRFVISKKFNNEVTYFGIVPTEEIAIRIVEVCKKHNWDIPKCKEIVKSWRDYLV